MQYIPQQLKSFTSPTLNIPATPTAPQSERDVQYIINGVFKPTMTMAPGETQIWAIANIHSMGYARVQLTETKTGRFELIKIDKIFKLSITLY